MARKKGACPFENVPNGITDDIEDILCGNSNAHLFAMSLDVIEQLKDRWETHYDFMDDYVYQAFETCAHTHHSDARGSFFLGEKLFRARPVSNDPKRAVERKRKTINAIESLASYSATIRRPSTTIARRNRREKSSNSTMKRRRTRSRNSDAQEKTVRLKCDARSDDEKKRFFFN